MVLKLNVEACCGHEATLTVLCLFVCLFFFEDISTDGQDLTLSKRVPVETSCSNAQSFQNASSAKTAGIY